MAVVVQDVHSGYYKGVARVHVETAAATLGYLTVEEYDLLVSCIHTEFIFRVVRVRAAMAAHPPAAGAGIPVPVREALTALEDCRTLMADLRIPELPPALIHARAEAVEEVRDAVYV